MKNIAFVGPMHSGKTTAANYLVEQYGYARIGLADEVKRAASKMLNIFLSECHGHYPLYDDGGYRVMIREIDTGEINDNKAIFRPFLQWLGTDFAREYLDAPNIWIDLFLKEAKWCNGRSEIPVVCDDVRFPNEAEALRNAGFEVIKICRPLEERVASVVAAGGNPDHLNHPSELHADSIISNQQWYPDDVDGLYCLLDLLMDEYDDA